MSTVLVVDDAAICREAIAAAIRRENYSVLTAMNGREALAVLRSQKVDLILLDLQMPVMDGLAFLEIIRQRKQWAQIPVIVLTATEATDCIVQARKLGAKEYLLKSRFMMEVMLERIAKCLGQTAARQASAGARAGTGENRGAGGTIHPAEQEPQNANGADGDQAGAELQLLGRAETKARLEKFIGAKTLAGSVAEVITLTGSPRSDLRDLVAVLKRDTVLSGRVLQIANSAAYASRNGLVSSVEDAVRIVGLRTIRNIATAIGMFGWFPPSAHDGFNLIHCWRHCFAVGQIMDWIVPASNAAPGCAHIVGLCHDLPEIVLRLCFAREYAGALDHAGRDAEPIDNVKAAVFGMLPQELNALVLAMLDLPKAVASPIREFLDAKNQGPSHGMDPLARALRLADLYSHGLLLASSPASIVGPITQADCRETLGTSTPIPVEGDDLRVSIVALTNLLSRLSPEDEAKLASPLLPQTDRKILFVRHPTYAEFDPLGAALQLLASPITLDHLPSSVGEVNDIQAIIVAAPQSGTPGFSTAEISRARKVLGNPELPVAYLSGLHTAGALGKLPDVHSIALPVALDTLAEYLAALPASSSSATPSVRPQSTAAAA